MKRIGWFAIALAFFWSCLAGGANAQTPRPFYQGKTITIVVGNSSGGIYDIQARLLARHISQFIPGSPTIVVLDMPGAGGLKAANYLYRIAPKDGSYFGSFANGLILQQLLDDRGIQFDARRFGWIGSSMSEVSIIYAWHKSKFYSLQDIQKMQMVVPGTGSGANSVVYPKILNAVLGTKFKVVSGYPGAVETMLAIERGEADGQAGGTWQNLIASKPNWISEHKIRVLGQLALKRNKDLPNVPLVLDLVKQEKDRAALSLLFLKQSAAFPFTAPPGLPAERLQILRRAFDATIKDPSFRKEAAQHNFEIDALSGEEVAALVKTIFKSPDAVVARARNLMSAAQGSGASK